MRADGDARKGGVPREHVPVHGDNGRWGLISEPSGLGEIDRTEDGEDDHSQPEETEEEHIEELDN